MSTFDLKKFLVENKLTVNSKKDYNEGKQVDKGLKEDRDSVLGDLEEMGYTDGDKAVAMHFNHDVISINNEVDYKYYRKGFIQSVIDSTQGFSFDEIDNMSMNEDKIDKEKIEGILWDLKNSNKLSNPSDPKKKDALIKKLEKQLSKLNEIYFTSPDIEKLKKIPSSDLYMYVKDFSDERLRDIADDLLLHYEDHDNVQGIIIRYFENLNEPLNESSINISPVNKSYYIYIKEGDKVRKKHFKFTQ